jgi:hypothetical protein
MLSFSTTYYPLEDDDVQDGCIDYVNPGVNNIVGQIEAYDAENYREHFLYEFDFYVPEVDANDKYVFLKLRRNDDFNTQDYCQGPWAVYSEINGFPASVGQLDLSEWILPIYPRDNFEYNSENNLYLRNISEEVFCTGADCPEGTPDKPGLCVFSVCGFYPEPEITATKPPSEVHIEDTFTINVTIINNDEVDASLDDEKVRVTIDGSDLRHDLYGTYEDYHHLESKHDAPYNRIEKIVEFRVVEDDHYYAINDLENGVSYVPLSLGDILVEFDDVSGTRRTFTYDLGYVDLTLEKEEPEPEPEPEPPPQDPPDEPEQEADPVCPCAPAAIILLAGFALRR